ncbi:GspE/PulE family protein [Alkalilimnicola sp. S0819]|uniref:GspE/PulE family protein n=1 Tax=Alkalilimnicola sp. S0819 TaxID=2613922 RepID=UPI001262102F|nr:GspE/PulE family protein [Alkalilimnicola sp. S0819]KAB7622638.1 MSHA biogenesis protein MshE [Alkalilimnicola sp. S0819]MPQ17409.1 MSHA biogenesis protein MshE [Alkalilimnicola sp. S0819]
MRKKIRIGDLLVQNKIISEGQLQSALDEQKRSGRKLGRTLIELGYLTEDDLLNFLSQQLAVPFVDLKTYQFRPETVRKLPETHARRYRAIVLDETDEDFLVGMADATDIFAYDELARILRKPVRLAVVRESELLRTVDTVYRRTEEISHLAEELGEELGEDDFDLQQLVENEETANAPVVKLLQTVFEDAVQVGASDIHIEPDEGMLRIRQRVDGVLQEHVMKEHRIAPALVLRLKLMAGLNISEKRLPQDGRFNIKVKGRSVDVRVSTMPVQHGESVVMRLLDQSSGLLNLAQLGMPEEVMRRFRALVRHPHGLVLVTGPTGSGKTTTLYGALSELNEAAKKIITVEDPVEYRLPRINQVQVAERIGLSFAGVLRAALRQDPDIVMVGEMRDQETAEIGLRAAVTGHLVLSTLHTNDAVSTAIRLLDMGAESFLLAASLRGIIAQRLLRRICDSCRQTYEPDAQERAWLRGVVSEDTPLELHRGLGCSHCNNTGYRGRVGVYELLELDGAMTDALRRNDQAAFARAAAANPDYRPLGRVATDYALQGVTSMEEVLRVAGELDTVLDAPTVLDEAAEA